MSSRKDYRAIAALLSVYARSNNGLIEAGEKEIGEYGNMQLRQIVDDLSFHFAADNDRFDREHFVKACGL